MGDRFDITRRYHFEAAHYLPFVSAGHKCARMHGHNYELEITVIRATVDNVGFVIDFWDLDAIVDPLIQAVDHRVLNECPGLDNPTAELIAKHFCERIQNIMSNVEIRVRCYETKDCWADYRLVPEKSQ